MASGSPASQRLLEEIQSLSTVVEGLHSALISLTEGPRGVDAATIEDVDELFSLGVTLLKQDTDTDRLHHLLFRNTENNIVTLLVKYLEAQLTVGKAGTQDQIMSLRVTVLKCLSKIIALTSYDHQPRQGSPPQCTVALSRQLSQLGLLPVLIGIAAGASHVPCDIKISSAECLFVYSLRSHPGRSDLVKKCDISQMLKILVEEKNPMVRNYVAATVRELATYHCDELEQNGLLHYAPSIITTDSSTDVRVLILESVHEVCKSKFNKPTTPFESLAPLGECIASTIGITNVDSISKIIDTCITGEAYLLSTCNAQTKPLSQLPVNFTVRFINAGGPEKLLSVITSDNGENGKAVALASRSLRNIIQMASWKIGTGRRLLSTSVVDIFSCFRKEQIDQSKNEQEPDLRTISQVELAIAVALMMAQSGEARAFCQHALSSQKGRQWLVDTRHEILSLLDTASSEYFSDIEIRDTNNGLLLNDLRGIEWTDNGWPTQDSVQRSLNGIPSTPGGIPPSTHYAAQHIEEVRRCRLTQVLLRYSIILTLPDGSGIINEPFATSGPPTMTPAMPMRGGDSERITVPPPPAQWSQVAATTQNTEGIDLSVITPIAGISKRPPTVTKHRATSRSASRSRSPGHSYGYSSSTTSSPNSTELPPRKHKPLLGFVRRASSIPPVVNQTIYDTCKFAAHDSALRFAIQYARHFSSVVESVQIKQPQPSRWDKSGIAPGNPWQLPVKRTTKSRVWTVGELKAGDLFIFELPHDRLSVGAVERLLHAAMKHQTKVKKSFLTTPQKAKGRRWCLYDLLNLVMPNLQDLLVRLAKMIMAIGEHDAHIPIFMLREKEIAAGETGIHPAILPEVVNQLTFYHQTHLQPPDGMAAAVSALSQQRQRNQQQADEDATHDPQQYLDLSDSSSSSS